MSDEDLRKLAERLVPDADGAVNFQNADLSAAASAILSLMAERDRLQKLVRETVLTEMVAHGQADENWTRATIAEARLGRALEALREIDGNRTGAGCNPELMVRIARSVLFDLEIKDDNG